MKSFSPRNKSNCIVFIISQFWKYGGYIVVRKSEFGWWPHFLWSKDLIIFNDFHPNEPRSGKLIPPVFYSGHVRSITASEDKRK